MRLAPQLLLAASTLAALAQTATPPAPVPRTIPLPGGATAAPVAPKPVAPAAVAPAAVNPDAPATPIAPGVVTPPKPVAPAPVAAPKPPVAVNAAAPAPASPAAVSPGGKGPFPAFRGTSPATPVSTLTFIDADTNAILDKIEQYTGREILRPQNLPVTKINFRSKSTMTADEAIRVLESLLSINGVSLTDIDERFRQAMISAELPKNAPVFIEDLNQPVPSSRQMFVKFFKLSYLTTTEAVPLVQPILSQGAPLALEKSGSLLITDTLLNLRRIEEVLDRADRATKPNQKIFFRALKNTNAIDLKTIFATIKAAPSLKSLFDSTVVEFDERTNKIMVVTHPDNYPFIETIFDELDAGVPALTKTRVFPLRFAEAEEIQGLITGVMNGDSSVTAGSTRRSSSSSARGGTSTTGGRTTSSRSNIGSNNRSTGNTAQAQPAAGGSAPRPTGGASSAGSGRQNQFSEHLAVIADTRRDVLVITGTEEDFKFVEGLIEQLDILRPQVRLDVVICEVSLDENEPSGLQSFGLKYDLANEITLSPGIPGLSGPTAGSAAAFTLKNFTMDGILKTASSSNKVSVLSNPSITTTHKEEGKIEVNEQRPILQGTFNSGTTGTSTQVNYEKIGLTLTVTPKVGSDGTIQLDIEQIIQSVTGNVTVDGNDQPIIGERSASSIISVKNGELTVLGGLQERSTSDTEGKFPIIGRIPLIGSLFNPKTNTLKRREILIFIRPTVLESTAKADADARERLIIIDRDVDGRILNKLETNRFEFERELDEKGQLKRWNAGRLPEDPPLPSPIK